MVIVLIFSDTYVRPKIHRIQKKKREKIHQWGGGMGDIYGTWYIYPLKCLFIVLCGSLLNSYEDEYTHYKERLQVYLEMGKPYKTCIIYKDEN